MRRVLVAVLILGLPLGVAAEDPLDAHARPHAQYLAATGTFTHSDLSPLSADYGGPCVWVGEALYRGGDPDRRWALYQDSPPHAAVVNYPWTHHGTGTVEIPGGYVVVDVFCVIAEPTTTTTTTPTTPTTTTATTTPPTRPVVEQAMPMPVQPFDFDALQALLDAAGLTLV